MQTNNMSTMVYKSKDIMEILQISKNTATIFLREVYENQKPFRVFKIGNEYRISKQSFDSWINASN